MATSTEKVLQLRQLLAERFGAPIPAPEETPFLTGLKALDEIGLPRGAVTEVVAKPSDGPGGSLLLYGLLHAVLGRGERVILIDGRDSFSPNALPQAELDRLIWVRCHEARHAIKAADLAVRDGNVPLVVLLFVLNTLNDLRGISSTAWQRLQLVTEKSGVALLAFTPQAQIGCTRLRLAARGAFPLNRLHVVREDLIADLSLQVERRRWERRDHEELRRPLCA